MTQEPTPWRDMTPEEKGALLLAEHEGKVIEASDYKRDWHPVKKATWFDELAYRIKPEPKRETVTAKLCINEAGTSLHMTTICSYGDYGERCHYFRLTFDTIDGKPDPSSIKIEEITQ